MRRYERKSVEVGVFRGAGHFERRFQRERGVCWYQSSRVIALSYGIKIYAVRHLVLSQYTRVTDGQTERPTDRQTDRITTPKTALAYARAVKTPCILVEITVNTIPTVYNTSPSASFSRFCYTLHFCNMVLKWF